MNRDKKNRKVIIAVITMILLIILSLWLFTKASEDTEETGTTEQLVYQSYRNNILGVAGDFCIFTLENATLAEVTADVAIGGDFQATSFGNYNTNWEFYKGNDLKFVNLNSYIRGTYTGGIYKWNADKSAEELLSSSGVQKGTFNENDVDKSFGQANIYLNTANNDFEVIYNADGSLNNNIKINGSDYGNNVYGQSVYETGFASYNVIGVDGNFINFESVYEDLKNVSTTLMYADGQIAVECDDASQTFKYEIPEEKDIVILDVNEENFFNQNKCNVFDIYMNSNQKIIINVDCTNYIGKETPKIRINGGNGWDALAENVIFNYYLADEQTSETQTNIIEAMGTILAPNMNIKINNLVGAVITKSVEVSERVYGINSNIGWGDIQKQAVERISISGTKIWNDKDEEDKRPEEITIKLLADGEDTGKTVTLPKVIANDTSSDDASSSTTGENDIEYYVMIDHSGISDWWAHSNKTFTVTIAYSNGQTKTISATGAQLSNWGYNSELAKITIPAGTTAEVTINVVETTTDYGTIVTLSENTAGINGLTGNWVTFKLASSATNATATIANVNEVEESETPVEGEEDNLDWTYKFQGLEKYDTDGKEINYTVEEVEVEGYISEIVETENGYDIINTIEIEITGKKIWDDDNDRDGKRPDTVTVELYEAGNDGEEDAKVDEIVVKQGDDEDTWSYKFEDVKKYDEEGNEIEYIVKEATVKEYETPVIEGSAEEGFTITNKYIPEKIDINVTKVWDDAENKEDTRPKSIKVKLYADGEEIDSQEIKEDANGQWKYTFTDLYKFESGQEIVYTITEEKVSNYEDPVIEGSVEEGFTITNKYNSTINIDVTKTWDDANNQDNIRPESITVRLFAGTTEIDSKTITKDNDWKYTFVDLQKYDEDGAEIVYTIKEDAIEGYETSIDGFNITNIHTPEAITISGTKTWIDNNDKEGLRPESITVRLFADGEEVGELVKTVTEEDEWKYDFVDLQKYNEDGTEIVYTIDEDEVEGYRKTIEGYNLTNTSTAIDAEKIESLKIIKVWNDEGYEEVRPEKVKVKLFANGKVAETIEITADDNWEYTFQNMERYDEDGNEIVYTVTEEAIAGYETMIDGFKITNTYIPQIENDEFVIKINKYQTGTTTKLEGAKFEITLKDKDDKQVAKETATTNSIGQIILKDIEIATGEYTLKIKETSAPKGYIIATETIKIEFTVSEDEDGKRTIKLNEKYKNAELEKMTITVKAENDKEKTKDTTTVTGKLPQTGAGSMIVVASVVIAFIVIGAIGIIKYREIKF